MRNGPDGDPKKVSVIVVNWNGEAHLPECLDALRRQSRAPDQIILVDNASTDGSREIIEQYPEVYLLALRENLGFGGGNLAGLEHASGDYIVLLNNDTAPQEDWLRELCATADEDETVGIVASVMCTWDGTRIDTAGDGCTISGRGFKLMHGQTVWEAPRSRAIVFSACAGAALYKREMIEDVGFLEPRFFMNAEDTDLAFRARLRGWKVALAPAALVRHRVSASQGIYSDSAVYFSARNHLWLYLRCMPQPLFWLYMPAVVLHGITSLLFFASRRQARPYLSGVVHALKGLRWALQTRQIIQSQSRVGWRAIQRSLSPIGTYIRSKTSVRDSKALLCSDQSDLP